MKYTIFRSGGKQYKASEGDILEIEHVTGDAEDYIFTDVLLYVADGISKIGNPTVPGVTVKGKILGQIKGEKIRVAKFKSKVRYRKVTGHRQHLSKIQVQEIISSDTQKKQSNQQEENPKISKGSTSKARKVSTLPPKKS